LPTRQRWRINLDPKARALRQGEATGVRAEAGFWSHEALEIVNVLL
jgi:hypothetical protein